MQFKNDFWKPLFDDYNEQVASYIETAFDNVITGTGGLLYETANEFHDFVGTLLVCITDFEVPSIELP